MTPNRSEVVLFGGSKGGYLDDTWTWDGTNWTLRQPDTSPSARSSAGITYDADRGEVVTFGGVGSDEHTYLGDTWNWDGTSWDIPFVAHLHLAPRSGPPKTVVQVSGYGFAAFEQVTITFIDSAKGKTVLGAFETDGMGALTAQVTIPPEATAGAQKIMAVGAISLQTAQRKFTVT